MTMYENMQNATKIAKNPRYFLCFVKISQKLASKRIIPSFARDASLSATPQSKMLLQYSVQNFLSFKDQVTLSMVASKRRSKNALLDAAAVFNLSPEIRLLKCAVIYGANNSGKSNLIKSLSFLRNFVINSSRESQAQDPIKVSPFLLNSETEKAASSFEILFAHDGYLYQYELAATTDRVEKERLSRKALTKGATTKELFVRDSHATKVGRSFKEGKGLEGKTRPNALFLSVCANFDGEISTGVLSWFNRIRIISGLQDAGLSWTASKLHESEFGSRIQNLLKAFDLGIDRYERGEEIPGVEISTDTTALPPEAQPVAAMLNRLNRKASHKVVSYHRMYSEKGDYVRDVPFDLSMNESQGTKKLVALAGPLVSTLEHAYILFIDELDSRLHSSISKVILDMFNSVETNPNGAQLIAATHDTNLLDADHLRRDQIWFAGRNHYGCSSLTSLVEFKVRNDASFEKSYLAGEFGGIPYLRPFSISPRNETKRKVSKARSSSEH